MRLDIFDDWDQQPRRGPSFALVFNVVLGLALLLCVAVVVVAAHFLIVYW